MSDEIMAQITAMAGEGLRTIGIAYCPIEAPHTNTRARTRAHAHRH